MDKVILNIPHSSTNVPEWAVKDMLISAAELDLLLDFMTDKDVDKIWGFVPAESKQVATVSRLIVDTERYRNDADEPMSLKGMGLYYTHTPDGKMFRNRTQDAYAKCLSYYDEYHLSLATKVKKCVAEHGRCVILDCHSFHDGMNYTGFDPGTYPDVCIGVNGRVDAIAQFVIDVFRSAGYSVRINEPFSGSLVPLEYLNDNRVTSVMIELNRRIYDGDSFRSVQQICREIYEKFKI